MLYDAFDAAALGLPIPLRVTPMKMLPSHNPPAIYRESTHASSRKTASPRNLQLDVHLYNESLGVDMGRVISRTADKTDENKLVMLTPLGRFVVENGVIMRGKIEKRSIFGTRVHETFPNA